VATGTPQASGGCPIWPIERDRRNLPGKDRKRFSTRCRHRHCRRPSRQFLLLTLEPLKAIHANPRLNGLKVSPVDPKMIWMLLIIAEGVLPIACMNFTTLAIGRSASRSKEVGVRKVIGGTKRALMFQFFTESILLTLFSTVAGLLLAIRLLPYFNRLSGRELVFSITQFPQLIGLIIAMMLIAEKCC
jgi:hypothetical protein